MSTLNIKILRIELDDDAIKEKNDIVAMDEAICIFINEEYYRTFIVTPEQIEDLVIGHLVSEGMIRAFDEIQEIEFKSGKAYVTLKKKLDLTSFSREKSDLITTACGALGNLPHDIQLENLWNNSELVVDPERIWLAAQELHRRSEIYKATGGTHSAILCSPSGEIFAYAADVGRHNAVDKVVGVSVKDRRDLRNSILVSSGRLSGEIVLKIARSGIPIVASVSGPLGSGIRIAEATGVTLICFIRGRRMNAYTHVKRISFG